MTSIHPNCADYRDFEIIAFAVRNGQVYRRDRQYIRIHKTDTVTSNVLKIVAGFVARGCHVLTLESDVVKRDWSRLDDRSIHALNTMSESECRALVKHTSADSWTVDGFRVMLKRCLS